MRFQRRAWSSRRVATRPADTPPLEKVEQAHIVQLTRSLGGKAYVIGTRRSRGRNCQKCGEFVAEDQGTHQTLGIPDLFLFLPATANQHAISLWWEVKARGGRPSPDQITFAEHCLGSHTAYGRGTFDDFLVWLVGAGRIKSQSIPHYRPAASAAVDAQR